MQSNLSLILRSLLSIRGPEGFGETAHIQPGISTREYYRPPIHGGPPTDATPQIREAKLASVLERPKAKVFVIALTASGSRLVRRKTSVGVEPIDGGSEIVAALVNKAKFWSRLVIIRYFVVFVASG